MAKLSIVIPFYNEEENVERVCRELSDEFNRNKLDYEIIAINNGSHDKTLELLDKVVKVIPKVKIITVDVNQGYGWGIIQGFKKASGEYIGYMPGDGQIDPVDVIKVFHKIQSENWDFGQGLRIKRRDGLFRKISSIGFNFIFQCLFPCSISDVGSNPKIMKRELYEKINPISKDWFIDSEVLITAIYLKSKLGEVPYISKKREKGSSHIKIFTIIEMLKNMFIWRFKRLKEKMQNGK